MSCDTRIETGKPKVVLLLSGKRKSGKDYVASTLEKRIGPELSVIIRLSGPLKKQYAAEHSLDYEQLLNASKYKELYRLKMITWGEEKRNRDPGFFCRLAIAQSNAAAKDIWIISDARRTTDIDYFLQNYPSVTHSIRIHASDNTRSVRGWKFTTGVDDVESECGLDSYGEWDFVINNDHDEGSKLCENLEPVFGLIKQKIY